MRLDVALGHGLRLSTDGNLGPECERWLEPEAYFDLGEHTISFHVLHGRGQHSGADVATPAAHLCRWRDGLIVYFKGYLHRQDAFRELGVSEDARQPIAP